MYFEPRLSVLFFFFNDTATTEIYTLSLHDALPISWCWRASCSMSLRVTCTRWPGSRSEEHTSELQSRSDFVCRLLLEKKKPIRRSVPGMRGGTAAGPRRREATWR